MDIQYPEAMYARPGTALAALTNGVYLVTSFSGTRLNGHINCIVYQVTARPPMLAVCIMDSGFFAISVLGRNTPLEYIHHFGTVSGHAFDKFEGIDYSLGVTGCPIPASCAVAVFEAEVRQRVDLGTHTLFIGQIITAEKRSDEPSMTYTDYEALASAD